MFIQDMSPMVLGAAETHRVCLPKGTSYNNINARYSEAYFLAAAQRFGQGCSFRKVPSLLYTPFFIMKNRRIILFPVQPANTWELGQPLMYLFSPCAKLLKSQAVVSEHARLHLM